MADLVASADGGDLTIPLTHQLKKLQRKLLKAGSTVSINVSVEKNAAGEEPGQAQEFSGDGVINADDLKIDPHAGMKKWKEELVVTVNATSLIKLDWLSKSDPIVAIFEKSADGAFDVFVGQTEWLYNDLDPNFTTPITIPFDDAKKSSEYKVAIYDVDCNAITETDVMGWEEFTFPTLLKAVGGDKISMPMTRPDDKRLGRVLAKKGTTVHFSVKRQAWTPPQE